MTLESALLLALSVASTTSAGLGAGLAPHVAPDRKGRGLVLVGNLFALPLLAWVLARTIGLGGASLGLVVAAAAPGGSTGPLMATLGKGDPRVAARWFLLLSIVGTATALFVTAAQSLAGALLVARAAVAVLCASWVPLVASLGAARRWPAQARALAPWVSRASVVLLLVTMGLLVSRHASSATGAAVGAGALLVFASLLIGALGPWSRAAKVAVAQVTTVRSLTLALVVLDAIGAAGEAKGAVLAYGLAMYVGAGAVALAARYSRPS